jgi:hypothetical protein
MAHRVRRCWIDHTAQGSDHQPLWVELAGAFPDFPLTEPGMQTIQPADSPRIPF